MLDLLLRMSGATLFYVLVTVTAWRFTSRRKLRLGGKILLGLLFGGCSVPRADGIRPCAARFPFPLVGAAM